MRNSLTRREAGRQNLTKASFIVTMLATSACVSLEPPQRPAYPGVDTVNKAHATQVIGSWIVTELNPMPGYSPQTTFINYSADRTVKGLMTLSGTDSDTSGDLEFEIIGDWRLEGDIISHQNIQMNSVDDDALGTMLSNVVNAQKGISGRANIYELSDNRMVMVGSDGSAMEYIRR